MAQSKLASSGTAQSGMLQSEAAQSNTAQSNVVKVQVYRYDPDVDHRPYMQSIDVPHGRQDHMVRSGRQPHSQPAGGAVGVTRRSLADWSTSTAPSAPARRWPA